MKNTVVGRICLPVFVVGLALPFSSAFAQTPDEVCPRGAVGDTIVDPANAQKGTDGYVNFTARNIGTGPEDDGTGAKPNYNYRFCLRSNTLQSPVVRVAPGENVKIRLSNELKFFSGFPSTHVMTEPGTTLCAPQPDGLPPNITLTNLHFHGLNISPTCGGDEVINTLIAPQGTKKGTTSFNYNFTIPANEPPGMHWFHPHVHGLSQQQLLGGMTGVMIVSGMEKYFPEVATLKERVLVLRDIDKANPAENPAASPDEPWKDVSVNYVPVVWNGASTSSSAAKLVVGAGERQFWRIANASADTHFVLKLQYRYSANGPWQDQPLEVVARDGVPHTDDNGSSRNGPFVTKQAVLPPGGRVEFVMTGPGAGVEARLFSDDYNTYLLSTNNSPARFDATDRNPARVLADIQTTAAARQASLTKQAPSETMKRFVGLRNATNVRPRTVVFTKGPEDFFITLDGAVPKTFNMSAPPDIVVNMPAVEEWTVENRDNESHVFHIHQIHFRVVEINGIPTSETIEQTMRDTIEIPACRKWGTTDPNDPYVNDPTFTGKNCLEPAKVKLRMDFREQNIAGTLVYHCHILEHEDKGMMAKIKLVWNPTGAKLAAVKLKRMGLEAMVKADRKQYFAAVKAMGSVPGHHAEHHHSIQSSSLLQSTIPLSSSSNTTNHDGKENGQFLRKSDSDFKALEMQKVGFSKNPTESGFRF